MTVQYMIMLLFYFTEGKMLKGKESILEPREITRRELEIVHSEDYLDSLNV